MGMSIWRIGGVRLVLHIFGMVAGIKLMTHANDFDAEQRSNEFKSIWRRLISDFRQIVLCWHREDDEFSEGQRQSAKGKMTPGKSGGKGKGKAISKGYQFSHHIQSLCGSRRRRGLFTPKKRLCWKMTVIVVGILFYFCSSLLEV